MESLSSSTSASPDDRASDTGSVYRPGDRHSRPPAPSALSRRLSPDDNFGSLESLSSSSASSVKMMDRSRSHNSSMESLNSTSGKSSTSSLTYSTNSKVDDKREQKYAHINNEHARLTELLRTLTGDELKTIIQNRLQNKDARTVVALSALLPRTTFPVVRKRHCVRCHKTYDPREHSKCVLKHPTSKVIKTSENRDSADFHCTACGNAFRLIRMMFYDENVNAYLSGFCYNGTHTADLKEMAATSPPGVVRTCEQHGCVEVYV